MADVTIESALVTTQTSTGCVHNRAWISSDVGYEFFLAAASNESLFYRKTTDGGASWSGATTFYDRAGSGQVKTFAIWADWWTKNDNGTKIHVVWHDGGDRLRYQYLDTAGDSIAGLVDVSGFVAVAGSNGFTDTQATITKLKGGNLLAMHKHYTGSPAVGSMWRSVNQGVSWTVRSFVGFSSADNWIFLPAAGTGDDNDLAVIHGDADTNQMIVRMHDDSANTWINTVIATYAEGGADYLNFDAMLGHDDKIRVVFCNDHNTTTADIEAWIVLPNAHPAPTPTQKTNVISNTQAVVSPRLLIDDATGAIYCFYLRGTLGSDMQVYYKKSTDDMDTWSSEVQFAEGSAGPLRNLFTARLIRSGDTGRIAASWTQNTAQDLLTNHVMSLVVPPAGATPLFFHRAAMAWR